jgi:hypothetical protein
MPASPTRNDAMSGCSGCRSLIDGSADISPALPGSELPCSANRRDGQCLEKGQAPRSVRRRSRGRWPGRAQNTRQRRVPRRITIATVK